MFKRFWWVFLAMLPVGAIGGLLVAAVVTYIVPKQYESEAVMEVRPPTATTSSGSNEVADSSSPEKEKPTTPQFFGTEFEKIKSSSSLGEVVKNLELVKRWGVHKETAIRSLKGIVNTQNIFGTDLISIKVRYTNREDARDIAAEVTRAYKTYRTEIETRSTNVRLKALDRAIRDHEDLAMELQKPFAVWNKAKWAQGIETRLPGDPIEDDRVDDGITERFSAEEMVDIYWETKNKVANTQREIGELRKWRENMESDKEWQESVVIHKEPQIAQSPVSPNVPLFLTLGSAGGILLSPLLALPVMLLLNRANPQRVDGPSALP